MMDTRDPTERLSSACRIEVGPETRERHLAELGAAIRMAPPAPVPVGFGLRRRVAAAIAAIFIVAPAGMALAAENAVPGDFLYPVKGITERVRSIVDHDIEATHRVEEVERLVFHRAPLHTVTRALERAESATRQLAESGDLRFRLERARERMQQQDEERQPAEENGSGEGGRKSGSDPGKTIGPREDAGSTAPSGSRSSTEQDQQRSGATDPTDGQDRSGSGSGGSAGSPTNPGGASSTTSPRSSGKSPRP
ncbi:MAG: hypothetical protein U9R47_06220 [Actinomycetota bacterium]|nr:hypothetical protein [Actinomycetota bacterium]